MDNKRGGIGIVIIVAITIILIGMTVVNILTPEVTYAKSAANGLDCTNSSITDGTKITCLVFDWVIPYWFILIFGAAGGIIIDNFFAGRQR